jgi:ABC-type bacteriocin/lantibiotic exporter with double-glycine peptidase domain
LNGGNNSLLFYLPFNVFERFGCGCVMISFLLNFYKLQKLRIVSYFIISLFLSVTTSIIPLFIRHIIDYTTGDKQINIFLVYMMIIVGFLYIVLSGYTVLLENNIISNSNITIRRELLSKIKKSYLNDIEKKKGNIIQVIINDVPYCQSILSFIFNFIIQLVTFIIILLILYKLNNQISLSLLLFIPIYLLIFFWFSKRIEVINRQYSSEKDNLVNDLSNIFANIRVLKNYLKPKSFLDDFQNSTQQIYNSFNKMGRLQSLIKVTYMLLQVAILIFVIIYGKQLMSIGELTIGEYVALIMYVFNFFGPIQQLVSLGVGFKTAKVAVSRVFDLFSLENEKDNLTVDKINKIDSIEVIDFKLPFGNEIKEALSFNFIKGKVNFILGPNGSGKTTFTYALNRFFNLPNSSISIESIDINHFSLREIREKIGIVYQDSQFISDDIQTYVLALSNSIYDIGNKKGRFITSQLFKFKDKDKIQDLSGGQKQLLNFLYELSRNTEVLIIDEGFSNLDLNTLNECMDLLYEISNEQLIIIITHDLSLLDSERINLIDFDFNKGVVEV